MGGSQSDYDDTLLPLFLPSDHTGASPAVIQAARDIVVGIMKAWQPGAGGRILIISNVHFMPSSSWALLEEVLKQVSGLLVVLTSRSPIPEPAHEVAFYKFAAHPHFHHRVLGLLTKQESLALIDVKFRDKNIERAPADLFTYIAQRSQGHPLLVEELVRVVLKEGKERKLVFGRDPKSLEPVTPLRPALKQGSLKLSESGTSELDTLTGVMEIFVNLRMDLVGRFFQLDLHLQLLLKVASVVGQTLCLALLQRIYPQKKSFEELRKLCDALVKLSIFTRNGTKGGDDTNLCYVFKVRCLPSLLSLFSLSSPSLLPLFSVSSPSLLPFFPLFSLSSPSLILSFSCTS
jgi:predicted ATPase